MTTIAVHTETSILNIVSERGHILLEQLPSCLPDLTWNQVFLGVDALSRQGAIGLRRRGFDYELWTPVPPPNSLFESSATAVMRSATLMYSR